MNLKLIFKYLFFALFVLINSCKNDSLDTVSKPNNLLSMEKIADVLVDMHLAEAGIQIKAYPLDSAKRISAGYDDFIFEKNEVNKQNFVESYNYYLSNPDNMDSVYVKVLDILSSREAKSKGALIKSIKKNKEDSIINRDILIK